MPDTRHFLFLQGPHGPFFAALGARLRQAGAKVTRVGVNGGDAAFWRSGGYVAFHGHIAEWADRFEALCEERGVTDIVCYGTARPFHRIALDRARALGLRTHCLEEGYIRPYWISYERTGTNAASPLTDISIARMRRAIGSRSDRPLSAPDRWGDMRAHMFWGAAYHAALLCGRLRYPRFEPHRTPDVPGELLLYLKRMMTQPARALLRHVASQRVRFGGFPYHLVLLQLAHDANFQTHGPFRSQAEFLTEVFEAFATGAPGHHHLVLKAHPLEDGREPLRPLIRRLARQHGLSARVHFISGGKLASLIKRAKSAVTVNSTSGEQALWHGRPLKAFGKAVYNRDGFTSSQPLAAFFACPTPPDHAAYLAYRTFLLETSQVTGGFYGFRSRRTLLASLPDLMLSDTDRYAQILSDDTASERQHLCLVS